MNIPTDLKYTKNDEWVRVVNNVGTVGITDFAQEQLSDIVYVEIVIAEGDAVAQGDSCATLESRSSAPASRALPRARLRREHHRAAPCGRPMQTRRWR